MERDETHILSNTLRKIIRNNKYILDTINNHVEVLKQIFDLDEIGTLRELLCVDIESAKKKLRDIDSSIDDDTAIAFHELFGDNKHE